MTDLNTRAGNFNIENNVVKGAIRREPQSLKDFFIEKRKLFLGNHSKSIYSNPLTDALKYE